MTHYILASTSPRRRELLKAAGFVFDIISPDYDENISNKSFSYELIETVAENKCKSAEKKIKQPAVIISADTVVIFNNTIMGKPNDFDDAFRMLSLLSGNTHFVVTAVCVINNEKNKKIIKSETSGVTFNILNKYDIESYINRFKPFDKAGSYGIQELNEKFVKEIKGDYENIVGLPTKMLINILEEITNI